MSWQTVIGRFRRLLRDCARESDTPSHGVQPIDHLIQNTTKAELSNTDVENERCLLEADSLRSVFWSLHPSLKHSVHKCLRRCLLQLDRL